MKVSSIVLLILGIIVNCYAVPNLVVIFADDLGYGDLGCFGNPTIKTPNLDRLAAEGKKLTQWYSAYSVCSPSRAALMTGRLPVRSGMASVFPCAAIGGLPANETTLPELLKSVGYYTGMIGKWHLGQKPEYLPTSHGFDYYEGVPFSVDMGAQIGHACGNSYFCCEYLPYLKNQTVVKQPYPLEDIELGYANLASNFITANKDKPFFLYLAHNHAHIATPTQKQWSSQRFNNTSRRGKYGDALQEMDYVVGQVMSTLRSEGLAEKTLVIFTSDNGPWKIMNLDGGTAGQLRGEKGTTWEGGIHMPAIAWWPGKIAPDTTSEEVVSTMDIYTTYAHLAGAKVPTNRVVDGKDISNILFNEAGNNSSPHNYLFFWNGLDNDHRLCAVRSGSYKMHFISTENTGWSPVVHNPPLLFNVEQDPSERFSLDLKLYPDITNDLKQAAAQHIATTVLEIDQVARGTDPSSSICCNRKTNCICGQ